MSRIVFNIEKFSAFLFAVAFIFVLTILYVIVEYIRVKLYVKKTVFHEKLTLEIVNIQALFMREKKALKRYPTLYKYVAGINSLFDNYLIDFRKAKIVRYDRPKEELRTFKREYREASTRIQELVHRYAELIKNIYRVNHPVRFLLDSFQTSVKIYFALFRLIMHIIMKSGHLLFFSSPFSQQRKRFEYAKNLETITESSEIKIAENREMNFAA